MLRRDFFGVIPFIGSIFRLNASSPKITTIKQGDTLYHAVDGILTKIETPLYVSYFNKDGQYHREDGPAWELEDSTKKWYLNGRCHRIDGPACEYPDGTKEWFLNGKLHRTNNPAIKFANDE